MYKVYFNHNVIEFTNERPKDAPLVFNKMLLQQLGLNIVKTLNPDENVVIYIVDEHPEECLSIFKNLFSPVTAAGGLVRNQEEDILMIYRNGIWDLPKGKTESGESDEETALREVSEECGIPQDHLSIIRFLDYSYHIYPQDDKWLFKTTSWYVMSATEDEPLTPQTEEGISELRWVALPQLKDYVPIAYPLIINLIMTYLSPSASE